jgi:hypothetical protein
MTEDETEDFRAYLAGEEVIIRGVERAKEQGEHGEWNLYVYLIVDYPHNPTRKTPRVPMGAIKCDGGLSALNDHLLERGLVPEWWVENDPVPDSLQRP